MAFNFVPKEFKFFDFLSLQAENIVKASDCFKASVKKGVLDEETVKKIKDLEHEGDTLSHEIVDMINSILVVIGLDSRYILLVIHTYSGRLN